MLRLFVAIIGALGVSGVAHSGPLFDAAARGDVAAVEKFLGEGVGVDQRGRNAETPLIAAALAGGTAIENGRAGQQECRERTRMPASALKKKKNRKKQNL